MALDAATDEHEEIAGRGERDDGGNGEGGARGRDIRASEPTATADSEDLAAAGDGDAPEIAMLTPESARE